MMKRTGLVLLCLCLAALAFAEGSLRFTILYTNDLHGWMLPFDYTSSNAKFLEKEDLDYAYQRSNAGGLARRATIIGKLRKESSDPVLLIDAGDIFNRGPWQALSQGKLEVQAYNKMGYDLCCVGNNDLKGLPGIESQALLIKLMGESKFPWLCANLTVGDSGQAVEGVRPYVVKKISGVNVGFLGLTSGRSNGYPQIKGWTVGDPLEAAKRWVPIARKECDILILVTHSGYAFDRQLVGGVPGIDAVIGGDSHTFLAKPMNVKAPDGREVPIVQGGAYGIVLGRITLRFENKDAWRLESSDGELLPIGSETDEDPEIITLLQACK
jgi:2',3'-cyclic-nucleotide 2'-phosphodiesterase (5'-nucleotidase family)